MWTTFIAWGSKILGFLTPISNTLKSWKNELFVLLAYWRGKKAGIKQEKFNQLDQVNKINQRAKEIDNESNSTPIDDIRKRL